VVADAIASNVEVITWISNRDFLLAPVMTDCPCTFAAPWCDLVRTVRGTGTPVAQRDAEIGFKAFGTMGIRDYTGAPRQPIFSRWAAARALPIADRDLGVEQQGDPVVVVAAIAMQGVERPAQQRLRHHRVLTPPPVQGCLERFEDRLLFLADVVLGAREQDGLERADLQGRIVEPVQRHQGGEPPRPNEEHVHCVADPCEQLGAAGEAQLGLGVAMLGQQHAPEVAMHDGLLARQPIGVVGELSNLSEILLAELDRVVDVARRKLELSSPRAQRRSLAQHLPPVRALLARSVGVVEDLLGATEVPPGLLGVDRLGDPGQADRCLYDAMVVACGLVHRERLLEDAASLGAAPADVEQDAGHPVQVTAAFSSASVLPKTPHQVRTS
jgi:hypothetical protein